jgi:hypothetical protein
MTLLVIGFFAAIVLTQIYFTRRVRAATAFTAGNVVVYRVGDGTAVLGATATAVFLDEYTPSGVLVQSIPLPTAVSGSNRRLTASGSATTEGFLTLSADGRFIVLTGYDAPLGTGAVAGTASATFNRVVGRVDAAATIDTTTAISDSFSGANPRSATSDAGSNFWVIGSANGVRLVTLGSAGTSTSISTTNPNLRGTNIFGGQLYISSAAGTGLPRMATVGSGTPTTTGQTMTSLPGFSLTAGSNGFFFADLSSSVPGLDTLYVADDIANQLQKYSLVGGSWISNGGVAVASARGLTGSAQGSTVTLFGTLGSAGTTLYKFIDSAGYNVAISGSTTTIASAGANKAFRGVVFTPSNSSTNPTLTVSPAGTGTGTVISSPSGINCPLTCSASYGSGTVLTLTPAANVNSTFTGWSGCDSVAGDVCTVTLSSSRTVIPTFASTLRTLNVSRAGTGTGTVTSTPAGINCPGTCTATYADGTAVSLTASADVNSTFTGWSGCDSFTGNTCNVAMTSTRSVTATFTSSLRVLSVSRAGTGTGSVTSSPAGINCGATCTGTYTDGTLVTLTASADPSSTFAGWSGACTGSGPCTITMDGNKATTATFNFVPPPTTIKISQVYGGGGNSGSTYSNDFVELYNNGTTPIDIAGWSVQYASAGAGNPWSGLTNPPTLLCPVGSCVIAPGHYFLVRESAGAGGTTSLPSADAAGVIQMSSSQAKIALVANSVTLSGTCPTGNGIVDFVGYGSASCSETTPTSGLSNTTAAVRRGNGCIDTDNNANDFVTIGPIPRNSASPVNSCGGDPTQLSGLGIASPSSLESGNTLLTVTVTPATTPPSTGIGVVGNLTSIGGPAAQQFYDDNTHGDAVAGDNVFSYDAAVVGFIPTGVKNIVTTITDAQARTGTAPITMSVTSPTCGVERWSVKTGTDPDAGLVDLNNPVPMTIQALGALTPPADPPGPPLNARIAPAETTVYVINGTMTLYKKENDVDYHVVIQDETGHTMIVELPCACCVGPSSPFGAAIAAARAKFDARFTATSSFQTANVPVQVKGVGFFDFIHGQTGVAPNGIELHPVLELNFTANTSTTLMSNPNPSQFGQAAAITATVSNGGPTVPTGSITFFDGATAVDSTTLDVNGQATFNTSTLSVGSHSITATYGGDSTSAPSTSTVLLQVVNKADQFITFAALAGKTYGDPPFNVTATASSGLPVSFQIQSGPATLSGNTVTITGGGNVVVVATQAGDGNYNPAPDAQQSFTVARATATIVVDGYTGIYDGNAHGATGSATGIHGEDLTNLLNLGASFTDAPGGTAHWSFAGDTNYEPANGDAVITINKATPVITWSNPADIIYGTGLGATQLNATANVAGSFNYTPSSGTVLNAGASHPLLASFTPTDLTNYNSTSKTVMINVLKANPVFSNLSSPTIGCTAVITNLSGVISLGSFVPTGDVMITFNAVTQNAAIQPNGSFSSSFATGSLTPANSPLGINYSYGGDGNFNPASSAGTLTIVDTVFPTITLNGNAISVWPPNHNFRAVSVADLVASAGDSCDTSLNLSSVVIASVSSDEGNSSSGDILIAGDCKSLQLRAERDGNGDGRVYTITFRVRDAVGNTTFATAQVTVPHDQGQPNAVNSGVAYTINSNCP